MKIQETDSSLVQRCLKQDRAAQFELFNKFQKRLFEICLRYADNEDEAMDFLQEGFIKVFKGLSSFNGSGSLEAWAKRVIINNCISSIRKKKWVIEYEDNLDFLEGETPHLKEEQIDVEHIIKAIQSLPVGYRTIFNLYAIEAYSHQEIAEELGISEGTSRSQYARAKKAIQKLLNQN